MLVFKTLLLPYAIFDSVNCDMQAKYTLLLVEDDLALNHTLCELFSEAHYQVIASTDGKAALEKLQQNDIDLVLSDLHMRPLDGAGLLHAMRANPQWHHIPVIFITADPLQEVKLKSLEGGVNDYLQKPFLFRELVLRIQNLLNISSEKRKKPLIELPVNVTRRMEDTLQNRIDDYLMKRLSETVNIDQLAEGCLVSRSSLDKKIRKAYGISTSEYIRNFKLKKARHLLENSQLSVKEISQLTGFNSLSYFSTCFSKRFGVAPFKVRHSTP